MQHPAYSADTVDFDVALLRIPTDDLVLQPSVACLPKQGQPLPVQTAAAAHKKCIIIGWGKEKNSNVYGTDVLHEAEVRT